MFFKESALSICNTCSSLICLDTGAREMSSVTLMLDLSSVLIICRLLRLRYGECIKT